MKTFTSTQKQRLRELSLNENEFMAFFKSFKEREDAFKKISKSLIEKNKHRLERLHNATKRPILRFIEDKLVKAALSMGFIEVVTPIIISRCFINKMGIDVNSPLWRQILWIDDDKCLRPMLAPNLYFVMNKLSRFRKPVKIFEIGPCFRKGNKGRLHIEEFTMFNIVELAPKEDASLRMREIIKSLMENLGLSRYRLKTETSEVYGNTTDILINGVEVASAAVGPNPLDEKWEIVKPWAGIGFGVERLAMISENFRNVSKVARSFIYLDGARLNI